MPKITFGIIVFNGMPFVPYCLRQLYPYAHEIIVVEGASRHLDGIATKNGHSTDGTLEELQRFAREEDPEHKITVVTKNGYWIEKDEQSRGYAERATGEYLWQIDIDEFYTDEHMRAIIDILKGDPTISAMSIMTKTYFGSPLYEVESYALREGARMYHRIFRWKRGYVYTSHRPPTVLDERGVNLREENFLDGKTLYHKYGIFMHHYSLLFPKQVDEKCQYYSQWGRKDSNVWAQNSYHHLRQPYRVHNIYESISWLRRSKDTHPSQVTKMLIDLQASAPHLLRRTDDIEILLKKSWYNLGIFFLKLFFPVYRLFQSIKKISRKCLIYFWRVLRLHHVKRFIFKLRK